MSCCSEEHDFHVAEIGPDATDDDPYCGVCGHEVDLVWRHVTDIIGDEERAVGKPDPLDSPDGRCESEYAEHWRDHDVCGMCGGAWVFPS